MAEAKTTTLSKDDHDYIIAKMKESRKVEDWMDGFSEVLLNNELIVPEGMTVDQVLYAYIHGGIRYNKDGSVMEEKDE